MTNFEKDCLQRVKDIANKLDNLDYDGLCDYFSDFLNVEYRVNSKYEYIGAYIYITLGGPNIWVDTHSKLVCLAWGSTKLSWGIMNSTAESIDEIFSE